MSKPFAALAMAGTCVLALSLPATPAHAANAVSYVSVTGDDGHGCSNTTTDACRTISGAFGKTSNPGQIVCVDSGDFSSGSGGSSPLSGVLTIDCTGTTAITNSIDVELTAAVITLRNLTLRKIGNTTEGIFVGGGAVVVENCVFVGFPTAGIQFNPSSAGTKLSVTDSVFVQNGSGSTGAGILIKAHPAGSGLVNLNRVNVQNNVFGIAVDGTGSTGGINMTIRDSFTSGNSQDGILATTPPGGAPIGMLVKNTTSSNNNIGIRSIGSGVTIRVSSTIVTGNGLGLVASTGGVLLSFGNNEVRANGNDGAFTGFVGLQ